MKNLIASIIVCFFLVQAEAQPVVLTVAKDGTGNFTTVQEAINAVQNNNAAITTVHIKPGVYKEKLVLPEQKQNVHFVGEDAESTILTFDDFASKPDSSGKPIGTTGSSSFFVYGNGFSAENITFENSAGPVGQAVAIRITGDRARFLHCRFLGFQDTLYTQGYGSRQFYYDCHIEGTVDFIFGAATALFERCTVFGKMGGYFTAPSTPDTVAFGYVFDDCRFIGSAPDASFFLGRPWRPYGSVVVMNSEISTIVKPEGWNNWNNPSNETTARFMEYNNYGDGADRKKRVTWSRELTEKEALKLDRMLVLRGWDPMEGSEK